MLVGKRTLATVLWGNAHEYAPGAVPGGVCQSEVDFVFVFCDHRRHESTQCIGFFAKFDTPPGVLFCPGAATSRVSQAADDPHPKDLSLFYQQNCASCHGADGAAKDATGKNLRGQDFTDEAWIKGASDVKMVKVILSGKFFGFAMPAFKNFTHKGRISADGDRDRSQVQEGQDRRVSAKGNRTAT